MNDMDENIIRMGAQTPIRHLQFSFPEGVWGSDPSSIVSICEKAARDNDLVADLIVANNEGVRVSIQGLDDDDPAYMRAAQTIFETLSDYFPQMEVISDDE